MEHCRKGEQARARLSEQVRQAEQKLTEKGVRDVQRHDEVKQRRDEVGQPWPSTRGSPAALPSPECCWLPT